MLWNVLIVKLEYLYTVNLYVFLSALYMLQYVPIVTILVNCIFFNKKKNDPYFGMGKNTKVMPQYPAIYIFSWEREGILTSQKPYIKTKYKCTFCPTLSMKKDSDSDKAWMMHVKIAQNMYIFTHKFCTFPVTEGNKI